MNNEALECLESFLAGDEYNDYPVSFMSETVHDDMNIEEKQNDSTSADDFLNELNIDFQPGDLDNDIEMVDQTQQLPLNNNIAQKGFGNAAVDQQPPTNIQLAEFINNFKSFAGDGSCEHGSISTKLF